MSKKSASLGQWVCYVGRRDEFVGMWGVIHNIVGSGAEVDIHGMNGVGPLLRRRMFALDDLSEVPTPDDR